jgi:hypothetical protein
VHGSLASDLAIDRIEKSSGILYRRTKTAQGHACIAASWSATAACSDLDAYQQMPGHTSYRL